MEDERKEENIYVNIKYNKNVKKTRKGREVEKLSEIMNREKTE